ncbi:MAG: RNA polymerase subunit sigma-70 [Spirochaetae bacterium HGW-Spirochaetae-1]|jgi:RNA polymerase sigma-70 factor (ECF subfamily)|nr:MAG: RNA polymerase subunit sigma-70 [Spirochaetae bacterium HGW-Spirochaetae-1]
MTDREFADIVGQTKAVVLSAVGKHLDSRHYHAIDDVVQETYLRAYKNLAKNGFRQDSSIGTWLYTIARNESIRMNMRLGREEKKSLKAAEDMKNVDAAGNLPDFEIEHLHDTIARLPGKYREVLELVARGFSIEEIAGKLGMRRGTVKSRTSRGKEMLKKMMQEVTQ